MSKWDLLFYQQETVWKFELFCNKMPKYRILQMIEKWAFPTLGHGAVLRKSQQRRIAQYPSQ